MAIDNNYSYSMAVAALQVGQPGTGPPSFAFGPPNLLAHPCSFVFGPSTFLVFGPPTFLMAQQCFVFTHLV